MSRTKIIGILMIGTAVLNLALDLLNGGGFEAQKHYETLTAALTGAGLITLRAAVEKK